MRIILFALGVMLACGQPKPGQALGACNSAHVCLAGQLCADTLNPCPNVAAFLEVPGSCFRDCTGDKCTCAANEECGGGQCNQGTCLPNNIQCAEPTSCPSGCAVQRITGQTCDQCVCSTCP